MQQLDLTEGVIWKKLFRYATPIVLSSVLQSAYSIADFMIAGYFVGKGGVSGINNSSQIMLIITQVIMGITIGGNILMSQYYGRRDHENRIRTSVTLFTLSVICGLLMTAVVVGLGRPMLRALGAPALEEATTYLRICAFGLVSIFGYNAMSATIRAVGNSKQPFYCVAVTAGLNVVLDILFMGPLQMGVGGAALATILAQTISFIISLVYVLRRKQLFGLSLGKLYILKDKLKQTLHLGIPTAIQMTVVGLSWLTMTFLINQYGVEASAASGIAAKIKDTALLFTLAISNAASTMVAQCLGAEKFDRASRVVHIAMRIAIVVALVLTVIIELSAAQLIGLFHQDAVTSALAVQNLQIEILAQVFYASFMVYNALPTGAGHTMFTLFSSVVNCIFARLILAIVLNHFYQLPGVFWACAIAPIASVPLGYLYEHANVWRRSLAKPKTETEGPMQESE